MSLQLVRQFLTQHVPDIEIIELNQSTTAVDLATKAYNVEPSQIAKTLSLKVKNDIILVVTKDDARLDNKKLKSMFDAKAQVSSGDEVVDTTGHPVGGVCPSGLETPISVCYDVSLKHYVKVLLATGAIHDAVRITPGRMAELTSATWVDVCQQCFAR